MRDAFNKGKGEEGGRVRRRWWGDRRGTNKGPNTMEGSRDLLAGITIQQENMTKMREFLM